MSEREFLFVYGTLMEPGIQQKVIGRPVQGRADKLLSYTKKLRKFSDGTFPVIVPDSTGIVCGSILELTSEELGYCDKYEGDAYNRFRVKLESGLQVWVYSVKE